MIKASQTRIHLTLLAATKCQPVFPSSTSSIARRSIRTGATASFSTLPPPSQPTLAERTMRFCRSHQGYILLVTTAAALTLRPHSTTTRAEGPGPIQRTEGCPPFGCPLTPHDVHYSSDKIKKAMEQIRATKRTDVKAEALEVLKQSTAPDSSAVTFTLVGYKGGPQQDQINQDRAIIVTPYFIHDENTDPNECLHQDRILMGVFDGHAPLGERVSEYTANELPQLLADKLSTALSRCKGESDVMEKTSQALVETFQVLDTLVPGEPSGGCTASVVLKQGRKIYVANAGDSRSFVVVYRPSTGRSEVVYLTREDKPSLPDEKQRIEAAGGQVYIPARGTSRVVYNDPKTGAPVGLAMSRSIGDWVSGKMGVIPDPIVHVLDIDTLVRSQLEADGRETILINEEGQIEEEQDALDDVYIFAVSATDGMMDYTADGDIATILSHSMFNSAGAHPVSACEHLVYEAAQAWNQAKQGRYRDDIAIAVTAIRRPPAREE